MSETAEPGSIGWCDLTVEHGEQIRDSYAQVTGWKSEDHSMGQYSDYVMKTATQTPLSPASATPVVKMPICRRSGCQDPASAVLAVTQAPSTG
ncbi:MAG: hypothetical protein QF918_11445 [Pirellulaceae bacterium]|jgi:hypothetical protein|nr:hypothetical protein [Pirellulaceae bacterium]MDP6554895.1 hypothetical protein [Pirellulaceae bacterium]MDP6722558.1 hypothetical protein [Pirellulaceae bacterium]